MTDQGVFRKGWGNRMARIKTAPRQPIGADPEDVTENRALFAKDTDRQAAIEKQRKRIRRALLKRAAK